MARVLRFWFYNTPSKTALIMLTNAIDIHTLSYILFNTRGTEMKIVGLQLNEWKSMNDVKTLLFLHYYVIYHIRTGGHVIYDSVFGWLFTRKFLIN